ncbi:hypothetical protein [Undibacterium sp. TC9W]|uniref:hypothetical protein n=1 Tax=Undibacterium sp. TC9W TaxID=3413053 RepID=UPI003BF1F446
MLQIAATILQIIGFLAEHKEQVKKLILDLENLIGVPMDCWHILRVAHQIFRLASLHDS